MRSTSFAPGQQVGRYTIRKRLAQGGMAEVYKADQELTGGILRPVALKVIRPEYTTSPDFREMFLDEARCASMLSHPNIVHIFDVGEADDLLYMAMELVPGETLATVNRTLREHEDKLTDEALYAIGIYTASALEAVHSLKLEDSPVKLVHRDVSPHNLLLSARGSLKLIDFGIAKAVTNRNLTSPGVTKGKAGYFSPEQAMGKTLDGRSDLFSLGVTLYKLAYGQTPFDQHQSHAERNGALVRGRWKRLEDVQPGLSPGLYEVVAKAMELRPDDRYESAAVMREALEQAAFSAGLRIGTKSLLGYVTDDGAITAVPTGSRNAVPALPAPPPPPTATAATLESSTSSEVTAPMRPPEPPLLPPLPSPREIQPLDAEDPRVTEPSVPPPRQRSTLLLAGAFIGAVALGIGLTVALAPGPLPATSTARAPLAKAQAPVVAKADEPPPAAPEPPDDVLNPADVTAAEPEVAAPEPEKKAGAPLRPKRAVATRPPAAPVPAPKAEAPPEAIPPGEGQLRISTSPASVASRVTVDRADRGPAPLNLRIASGRYAVIVQLPGGKQSPEWRGAVLPDATTVLIYDIDAGKWQKR